MTLWKRSIRDGKGRRRALALEQPASEWSLGNVNHYRDQATAVSTRGDLSKGSTCSDNGQTRNIGFPVSQKHYEDQMSSEVAQNVKRKPVSKTQYAPGQDGQVLSKRPKALIQGDAGHTREVDGSDRRRKDRRRRHEHIVAQSTPSNLSQSSETDLPLRYLPDLWAWIGHLPQSADDKSIIDNVQRIFSFAEQYVNNFYMDEVNDRPGPEPFVERRGFFNVPEDCSMADLICSIAHPTTIIRHSLVATLLSAISPDCPKDMSPLLPSEFMSLARVLRKSTAKDGNRPHFHAALCAHRVLSHYIRGDVLADASYIKKRDEAINDITKDIEEAFAPWINNNRSRDQRGPVLISLLQQTAELGILIFSQASTFSFDWQVKPTASRDIEIAIAPRLFKVFDENAQLIEEHQHMIWMKTERTKLLSQLQPPQLARVENTERSRMQQPPPIQIAKLGNHAFIAELPAAEPSSDEGFEMGLSNHATYSAVVPAQSLMQEVPGKTIASHARTTGPAFDEPDFGYANGEGLSNSLRLSTNLPLLDVRTTKPLATVGESFVDAYQMQNRKYNEFVAVEESDAHELARKFTHQRRAIANVELPQNSNSQATNPASPRPPPNSYREGNGALVRSESADRGRGAPSTLQQRSRSRSMTGRSSTWSPNESDGREISTLHEDPAGLSQRYAEKCTFNGRARNQRTAATVTPQPATSDFLGQQEVAATTQHSAVVDSPGRHITISNDRGHPADGHEEGRRIGATRTDTRPATSAGHESNEADGSSYLRSNSSLQVEQEGLTQLEDTPRGSKPNIRDMFRSKGKNVFSYFKGDQNVVPQ